MLETKSIKVQGILKEIHEKVQQKAGRFERISEDIVLENLTLCSVFLDKSLTGGDAML